jgi:thioredoxin-dependent peroxiredoxin
MLTRPWTGSLTLVALLGLALAARAADAQETALVVGDRAPVFEAIADDGQVWRSRDHVGKGLLVVYFYPAAMTSGCTAQACSFRDNRSRLQELGAEVVGVSGDRLDGLRAFKGSNRLNFPLLSDTAGTIARAFGVPLRQGGSMTRMVDGRETELTRDVTAARWTFIIGRDGRIAYRDTQVDPAGDGDAVLAALRRLRRSGGQE